MDEEKDNKKPIELSVNDEIKIGEEVKFDFPLDESSTVMTQKSTEGKMMTVDNIKVFEQSLTIAEKLEISRWCVRFMVNHEKGYALRFYYIRTPQKKIIYRKKEVNK